MRRSLILTAAGAALLSLVAIGTGYRDGPVALAADAAPEAAPPRNSTVSALGRIEPRSEIVNLGGAPSDVLQDLSVTRGSTVARGETIGHFRAYDEAVTRERTIRAQLAEAIAQRDAERALGEARIKAAQAQLDGVVTVGAARIQAQQSTLKSLDIDLDNNIDILTSRQALFRRDAGSRRGLADQEALVERSRASLDAARARLVELDRQAVFDRANAEAALAVEQATLLRTQVQIPVASLEQQVALAKAQIATASLVAPIDGTVLNVLIRPGGAVGSGPILVLGDTTVMVAVAEVYETDVRRVRLGQRAKISGTALTQPLAGTVIEIGRMVYKNDVLNVDPAAKTDARIVQVRVALTDGAAVAGLTNLTVDVAIDTGPQSDSGSTLSSAR